MEEKLQAGLPSQSMIVFAVAWFGVIGYAAVNGAPRDAFAQQTDKTASISITDVTSAARPAPSKTPEIALMENGYDFDGMESIPGFGPLTPEEVQRAVDHQLRFPPKR
jgi:hypothetical protein